MSLVSFSTGVGNTAGRTRHRRIYLPYIKHFVMYKEDSRVKLFSDWKENQEKKLHRKGINKKIGLSYEIKLS